MKRWILLLLIVLAIHFSALTPCHSAAQRIAMSGDTSGGVPRHTLDEGEQGPAAYFYMEYYQEPWRLPESNREILKKSAEVALGVCIAMTYLYSQKTRA